MYVFRFFFRFFLAIILMLLTLPVLAKRPNKVNGLAKKPARLFIYRNQDKQPIYFRIGLERKNLSEVSHYYLDKHRLIFSYKVSKPYSGLKNIKSFTTRYYVNDNYTIKLNDTLCYDESRHKDVKKHVTHNKSIKHLNLFHKLYHISCRSEKGKSRKCDRSGMNGFYIM